MTQNERKPGLLAGWSGPMSTRLYILFWLILALTEASLAFSQFGIMSFGSGSVNDVNIVLLLAPIALAGFELGVVPGVSLGLLAGVLLAARSAWTPTSFFDMYLADPALSVAPLFVGSLASSLIFAASARRWASPFNKKGLDLKRIWAPRIITAVVGCLVLAAFFSLGARGALYFFFPEGSTMFYEADEVRDQLPVTFASIELLINAAIITLGCLAVEVWRAFRKTGTARVDLRTMFQTWLILAMVVVFLLASTVSFCLETQRANLQTNEDLDNILDYLELQVEDHGSRIDTLKELESESSVNIATAAAELIAADQSLLTNQDRLRDLADMLGLESLSVTDAEGYVIADSEYGTDVGFTFASTDSTKPYMDLINGKGSVVEEPRASIDPDGTASDKVRVFCGVPRIDAPGIVQVSTAAQRYQEMLSAASLTHLTDDYVAANGGTVAIVRDYQFVTSNDPELAGKPVVGNLTETKDEFDEFASYPDAMTGYNTTTKTVDILKARKVGDYTLMAFMPLPATYTTRTSTLMSNGVLFLALLTIIFIICNRLLRNVVVAPISRTNDTLGHITAGNLNELVNEHNVTEFTELSTGINTTVAALRESIDEAEQRNAQELITAKAIQESSLPREFPPFPDIDKFDIYASMKTAKEVGGDFYDFFLLDEDKLGFLIADVSGKGIPAALFMMTAKTQVRNYMEAGLPIDEAVNAANHQLCLSNDANMFVTMFACMLNYETGELSYVNAGHNPPLIHTNGTWEWIRDTSGMPLGLFDGLPYDKFDRKLQPGEMLYLYTDGVTEAMNASGELFGEERLEKTLYEYAEMNPRSVGVGVRRAITDFTLDCDQSDDITMLALKYGVPPEKRAVMILRAEDKQLVHVCNFIHEELHRRNAPKSVRNPLDIAAEELFVNVCHYAYPDATPENPGEVRIGFEYEANPPSLTVQISDDGIPYNPLAKPDAVTPDNIADVPIGGLGILMAKNSVDEMSYERVGKSNVLTFKKGW